ncbi:MAG: FlgD immunoglobulin-like domain containing protein [Candidatus Syntrophosphaera sp.]
MKKILISTLLALFCLGLGASRWQTITNTSHVYDLMEQNGNIIFSTWGGVVELVYPSSDSDLLFSGMQERGVWTTADGLASNDVRNIEYIEFSQSFWFGSAYNGISIVSPQGVQQLNSELGLPSDNVTGIVERGSEILVATGAGIASYYYLEGVNFPLLLHEYTTQNTGGNLLSNSVDAMVLAENDYLFISSAEGINFVHLDSLNADSSWHAFEDAPWVSGYEKHLCVNAEKLLVALPNSVHTHSIEPWVPGWESHTQDTALLNEVIASACIDGLNNIWVSYGLWDEDFLLYTRDIDTLMTCIGEDDEVRHWAEFEAGLGDKSIRKIVSLNGDLYLCGWGDGIFKFEGEEWLRFQPNSIGFPKIRNITTDQNHAAWFSSGVLNTFPLRKSALGVSRYLDGDWETYTVANSPIHTDNVYTVAVDSRDRKWFGTYDVNDTSPDDWRNGVTIWDEEDGIWKLLRRDGQKIWDEDLQSWGAVIPGSDGLLGNTAVHIARDLYGNMLVCCFDDGFSVFDPEDVLIGEFRVPNSVNQRSIYSYHNGRQYFIGTYNDRGLVIWNDDSIPTTDGPHWVIPEPSELSNCEIFGVVSVQTPYEGLQHWIAASNGLFMWDEQDWYKWDTSIKRFKYNSATGQWENDILYYVDEERLYGSVRTTPTAIYLDPFNRVWIGSLEHGISMYDPQTERFTNYYQDNSPLISDYITSLGYTPVEGLLLIGTPEGLNTLQIGRAIKPETELTSLKIYPNPFRPDEDAQVLIVNHPQDTMPRGTNHCRIYDASGALVRKLEEDEFARFAWDGLNAAGKKCSSGIYFAVVNDDAGNRAAAKIALLH